MKPAYGASLALIVRRNWSPRVRWEFYTLRNSLNLLLFATTGRLNRPEAFGASSDFIERNGLGRLFKPSSFRLKQ